MCSSPELSNKKLYSTFVRTYAQTSKLPDFLLLLLDHFKWSNVGILYENSWLALKDNIKKRLKMKEVNIRVEEDLPDFNQHDADPGAYNSQILEKMKRVKDKARSKRKKDARSQKVTG